MKNKEFHKLLKKNKFLENSGFTLTELLVGLIMSIFVVGALGFGLTQILRVTQTGNSQTTARTESSRALYFISDEMRRAQFIEVDMSDTNIDTLGGTDYTSKKKPGAVVRLALQIPGVDRRVIYSVAPPTGSSPWKGPNVIYRWGPNLDANGNYTDPNDTSDWQNEALVDGISDVTQNVTCGKNGDGTAKTISYEGFFACVVDDDGNGTTENAADTNGDGEITFADDPNDRNGDGEINFGDTLVDGSDPGTDVTFVDSDWDKNKDGLINADDATDNDGLAITAQLYFTGETKDTSAVKTSSYSADTKTVARARTTPDNNANNSGTYVTSYRSLDPSFACSNLVDWRMRTDFGDSFSNPSNLDKWNHKTNAQPQPVSIDGDTLVISSVPRGVGDIKCLNSREGNGHGSTGTEDFTGNKSLGLADDWHTDPNNDIVAISHVINFNDPRTFNGDPKTCTSDTCASSTDGKVYTQKDNAAAEVNPYVIVLKNGSLVPSLNGYDMNGDGDIEDSGEQVSLGEFLKREGYAISTESGYEIKDLDNDQRIIAFEIGKSDVSDTTAPGVDFQDNIFILQSDAFSQKYATYKDYDGTPQPYSVPY